MLGTSTYIKQSLKDQERKAESGTHVNKRSQTATEVGRGTKRATYSCKQKNHSGTRLTQVFDRLALLNGKVLRVLKMATLKSLQRLGRHSATKLTRLTQVSNQLQHL